MAPMLLGALQFLLALQATPATLVGIVRDADTGKPLAGAVVALVDIDRITDTDENGRYVLHRVPPGPQHIAFRFIGYERHTLLALVPQDQRLEINVTLQPEPIHLPAIQVHAPVIVPGVDVGDWRAFPDRENSIAAVRNHPLLAEPDVFQSLGGGEVVSMPESPSGVHIRGGASDQTAYLLDGIPVFSPYHAAGVSSAWSPDAISRLTLSSSAPSVHTLGGVIEATTLAPGPRLRAQGTLSSTQARLTLDGPLGVAGAAYVVSVRSGLPGAFAPKDDPDYLKGESGDWLAKVEMPVLGGQVRFLGYDSANEIGAAAVADAPGPVSGRNVFEWHSQSLGAEWRRDFSSTGLRLLGWSAASDASSNWTAGSTQALMAAERGDAGVLANIEHRSKRARTIAGIRLDRSTTSYRIESDSTAVPSWSLGAQTPVIAAFALHARKIGPRMELDMGASLATTGGDLHVGPRAQLRWNLSPRLALSGSYARTHQFAQSLRNAESLVGSVFPVDLYMGAGAPGVPVGRSDQGVVAAVYRPSARVRLGLQLYERVSDGLLLVAPRDGGPFTTSGAFAVGSSESRGLSADASVSATHYGIIASYGLQRVRFGYGESSYVPDHGAVHLLESGVIVFPTGSFSIRVGAKGALGRRTTAVSDGLLWEACNLLDRGCEFGGSANYNRESLGATTLPAYWRIDLGFRKSWHLGLAGRDASIAVFGTVTNILDRKNVLTYARNPSTGELVAIEMSPLVPLVVGLEWRY